MRKERENILPNRVRSMSILGSDLHHKVRNSVQTLLYNSKVTDLEGERNEKELVPPANGDLRLREAT